MEFGISDHPRFMNTFDPLKFQLSINRRTFLTLAGTAPISTLLG